MPNYCENYTQITGPAKEIERFVTAATDGSDFALKNILPLPAEATTVSHGVGVFTEGGYDMALELWGTKWGDFEGTFEDNNFYRYTTAWGPMDNGLRRISEMFPKLVFDTYWHEEDFHYGAFRCVKGEIISAGERRLEMPEPPSEDNEATYDRFWEDQQIRLEDAAVALGQLL